MGKKTSMYLTDDLIPRVEAATGEGVSLADLVRQALDAPSLEDMIRRVIREELAAALGAKAAPGIVPFKAAGQ
jgi:hypothetical protein